ncbi:hypothetical protein [Allobranchiibius sp. GilTou38]|uniref:hypothetical protein n=1 Tax=Allobranchiibius sp. GilTou38 TaxID=2815210 RepID=UPI001AA1B585|nr:hypothetical protein [Allobranchiibius sp. GilTou38]MBO1766671.1 hypothetical protein [Allobranchiibius sp. GilTou38]
MPAIPGVPNPFDWLANAAGRAVTGAWITAMLGLWNAGLWMLRLVLNIMDAFLTPDLRADGPGGRVYQYTFWIAGSLVVLMLMIQLGAAAIRRDGKSIATALIGSGQFCLVWSCWVGGAVAVLAAAGGLTRALMTGLLGVSTWSGWKPFHTVDTTHVTDGTVATILGGMGCLLWLAAIGHLLVMLTRAGALLVLSTTTPLSAAGLVADAGRGWFWKSLRWFLAAAFTPVIMVLVLGVGVQLTTGVATGMTDSTQAAIGTAVPSVILTLISCFCPLALFKLLAFVDPGSTSGAALRSGLEAQGGLQGLLGGRGTASDGQSSSAASSSDQNGTSGGEMSGQDATLGRFTKAQGGTLGEAGGALGGVAMRGRGALWAGRTPPVPPPGCTGPTLAVQPPEPAAARQRALMCVPLLALSGLFVWILGPVGLISLVGPAAALNVFLLYRRHFVAVGQGWWLERSGMVRAPMSGHFADLTSVAEDTDSVVLHLGDSRHRFPLHWRGPVAHHVAEQILASSATVTPDAAGTLKLWRDSTTASPETATTASGVRAHGKRPWQLMVSGTMLLIMGIFFGVVAGKQLKIRYDPDDVTVTAAVDRVYKECGRGGCRWWSNGHYTVGGKVESGVAVANDRDSPERAPQRILVNPAHPRDVVNTKEAGRDWFFFIAMLLAVPGGAGFLWWWAHWNKPRRAKALPGVELAH